MAVPPVSWRRCGRVLLHAGLAWLLLWACLVMVASLLLPRISWQAGAVGQWLGERAGMPVAVRSVQAHWTRRGPVLQLDGLALGEGGQVQVGRAQLLLAVYSGLLPGHALSQIQLQGLDLTLRQQDDGRWQVSGLGGSDGQGDPLDALSRLGEVQLSAARLHVQAPRLGIDRRIERVDLRLRVSGARLRAGLRGWISQDATPLLAVVDIDRHQGSGRVWVQAQPQMLSAWQSVLGFDGVSVTAGNGQAQLWAELDHWTLQRARLRAHLAALQLSASHGLDHRIGELSVLARWQRQADGWQLDVPTLRIDDEVMDGLQVRQGELLQVHSPAFSAGPWLQLLALSERLPLTTRRWLQATDPQVRVGAVNWHGSPSGYWRGTAQLREVAFAAIGNAPGISGLGGTLEADTHGMVVRLDPSRQARLDWPRGFGVEHLLHLDGEVAVWPQGDGWQVGTSALRVDGTDYAAWLRGGAQFQGDGSRPRLTLAAALDDAPITAARRFWIRSLMSPGAIAWLDDALVAGELRGGYGLVSGDLDDWPFIERNGLFKAGGQIVDGQVHFADGWADLAAVDAAVTFQGNGFQMAGSGNLGGVDVPAFSAGIARFSRPELAVRASGSGQADNLLTLLRASPLHKQHGATLQALSATGPVQVEFALDRALYRSDSGKVAGTVQLQGVALADKRWEVAVDQVHGSALYGNTGFHAPALSGVMDHAPVQLALRAGSHVQAPGNAFEARLAGSQDIHALLARAPDLAWLGDYLKGRSHWNVGVDVPADAGAQGRPMAILDLGSDLVGTRMLLPAPLDKAAAQPLATRVRAPLPMGTGALEIGFGQRLGLLVDSGAGGTAALATLGSARAQGTLPSSGLRVNGRTGRLDALPWIALAKGGDSGNDAPAQMALRDIDLHTDALALAGGLFPSTRLRLVPGNGRVSVQLDGPSLAGTVIVPEAAGATVVGKLSRLHWSTEPALAAAGGSEGRAEAALDPAAIPPLALDVAALQVGGRPLGSALMRSHQLADGMQVDVLQLRSPGQVVDLQGSWRGVGSAARTRLDLRVDSQDMGALAGSLGQPGQLRGGSGQLQLQATWPGSPQQFAPAAVQGQLRLALRNGQLLEVDPGVGRVLGLLSVAQLPRRVLLDFRDLFSKGLAFNQISAEVAFADGSARSRGIHIDSSAADIRIHGQTDLVAQRFDQTVEVNPHSGNLLTVVGAVAGGPVGAAVGAAANAVLARPLAGLGARTYQISGPWKDPQVAVIERGSARPSPSTSDAPNSPDAQPPPASGVPALDTSQDTHD